MPRLEDLGHFAQRGSSAPTVVEAGFHYAERSPPAHLLDVVVCAWRSRVAPSDAHRQRVLPDGCVEIVFASDRPALAYGPRTTWQDLVLPAGAAYCGVRLRPGVVELLGHVATDLAGQTGQLGPALAPLPEASGAEQLEGFLEAIAGRFDRRRPDAIALEALHLLHAEPGVPVAVVARRIGVSERQLRRRFTRAVGLAPGAYRRLARVNATLQAAHRHSGSWANLAYELGYADQAHLSREVRALTGWSPTTLVPALPAHGVGAGHAGATSRVTRLAGCRP